MASVVVLKFFTILIYYFYLQNDPLTSWQAGKLEKENLPLLPSPVKCSQSDCVGKHSLFEDKETDVYLPDVDDDF